jgi:hypothetical protein
MPVKRTSAFALAELDEVDELVLVRAAQDDRVDLHAPESGARGGVDPGEHRRESVAASDLEEALRPQRVEAHRDAVETRARERGGVLLELDPVRRQREIADRGLRGEQLDQPLEVLAQERLAARQPHLLDAGVRERVDEGSDLLEVEDVAAREPDVLPFRHAELQRSCSGLRPRSAGSRAVGRGGRRTASEVIVAARKVRPSRAASLVRSVGPALSDGSPQACQPGSTLPDSSIRPWNPLERFTRSV